MFVMQNFAKRTAVKLAATVGLVAMMGTAACVAGSDSEQAEPVAQEQVAEHHHHKGPVAVMVEMAIEHGDLTTEQYEAITAIGEEHAMSRADKEKLREEMKASAAGIVRAGTTDSDEFDGAVDRASSVVEARINASAASMKKLHAALEPDQRVAVADAIAARMEKRFGKEGWKRQEREQVEGRRVSFKQVATHLALSSLQIDKLKMLRDQIKRDNEDEKRFKPSRKEVDALVQAFKTDSFGDKLDAFNAEKVELLRDKIDEAGQYTDTALSFLSDDQRGLLAEMIEQGPRKVLLGEEPAQAE